jgi:hypothetical protein
MGRPHPERSLGKGEEDHETDDQPTKNSELETVIQAKGKENAVDHRLEELPEPPIHPEADPSLLRFSMAYRNPPPAPGKTSKVQGKSKTPTPEISDEKVAA